VAAPESRIIITADVTKVSEGFARVEADATRLTGALGKIGRDGFKGLEQSARQGLGGVQTQISGLTSLVGRLSGALALIGSASGVVNYLRDVVNQMDALGDAATATGASIENLSALEDVGRRAGTTFDTVTGILVKFNAQLQAAGDPSSNAAQALTAIGLSAEELRQQDPAEALKRVAEALSGYADDANKARLVQVLFGKSVQEASKFLNDLASVNSLVGSTTKEQVAEAQRFNDQLDEAVANVNSLTRSLLGGYLPAFNNLVSRMREEDGFFSAFWRDRKVEFSADSASRNSQAAARSLKELEKLLAQGGGDVNASPYTKIRVRELREQIEELTKDAFSANERVKGLLGGARESAQAAGDATKAALLGAEGYGERQQINFQPEPARPPAGPRASAEARLQGQANARVRTRSITDDGTSQILRDFERQQQEAARFGEQLLDQTAQINVSLITNDRQRGEAQIELDRRVMQERLTMLKLQGVNTDAAQVALNANIVARQASLNEALKPQWQVMLDGWNNTTEQMAKSYDNLMTGVVVRTEDALADFLTTGRLNIDSLVDYVTSAIARMAAQQAIAGITNFVSLMTTGFAKGGAFGSGGEITAFANGGVVSRPTFFGYAGGRTGLMGEAGPEAIMPLTRGPDGKLGVQSNGGQGVNVTINAQSGVTRAELAAMLPMIKEQLKAELVGSMRRPGFAG